MEKKAKKTVKKPAQTRQKASRSTRKKTEKNNLGLYANLVHRNKTKKDALSETAMAFATKVYEEAAKAQQENNTETASEDKKEDKKDDAIDAEFEEK